MRILTALLLTLLTAGIASAQGYDPITAARVRAWRIAAGASFPTDGLVAYWSMDSVSGTNVYDTFGSNDGTAVGSPLFDAAYGKYLDGVDFNGSSQLIKAPDFNPSTTTLTVMAWVNSANSTGNDYIVAQYRTDNNTRAWRITTCSKAWTMEGTPDGNELSVIISGDGAGAGANVRAVWCDVSIADGSWHHVCFTFSAGTLVLYVDGIARSQLVQSDGYPTAIYNTAASVQISGANADSTPGGLYDGSVDEVAIFNRALTSNEVYRIGNTNNPVFYTP